MQSTLAYNVSSQLVSSIKDTFIESKCREGYVSQHGKKVLAQWHGNPRISISYTTFTIPAQSHEYKIFLLCASYKPRVPCTLQNKAVVTHTVRDGNSQKGCGITCTYSGWLLFLSSPLASTHHSYILQRQHCY